MNKLSLEYSWFIKHQKEIAKYTGKHIAIVDTEIVASGKSAKAVYDAAKRKYPNKSPLIHYVQSGDLFVL